MFDVIISNPPYQKEDGGFCKSAMPIYHKFIEKAKEMNPRYMSFITPSRWMKGGRGLDEFRQDMLTDKRMAVLHDFCKPEDVFPDVDLPGGVCYFLWSRWHDGECLIYTHQEGDRKIDVSKRFLLEDGMDTYIRQTEAIPILRKVQAKNEKKFDSIVSTEDPYGMGARLKSETLQQQEKYTLEPFKGAVTFFYNGYREKGLGYIREEDIPKGFLLVDTWRVLVPRNWGKGKPRTDRVPAIIAPPHSVGSDTYLNVGSFDTEEEANNLLAYMRTRFFHFMVSIRKVSQHASRTVYREVPLLDLKHRWTDEELYARYGLTDEEVNIIKHTIRPQDGERLDYQVLDSKIKKVGGYTLKEAVGDGTAD